MTAEAQVAETARVRVKLVEALLERHLCSVDGDADYTSDSEIADALLPVVQALVAEGQAEALRAATVSPGEEALRLIDRNGCDNYTGAGRCLDPHSGRTRGAQYGADQWCDPCIARAALAAMQTGEDGQ